jgi:hypothetical protein
MQIPVRSKPKSLDINRCLILATRASGRPVRLSPTEQKSNMRHLHMVPTSDRGSCDFCAAQPIQWLYPCRNFSWQQRNIFASGATGFWAACRECSELVDSQQWNSLTERSLREFVLNHASARLDVILLRQQFRAIHELFREHRILESQMLGLKSKAD